VQWKGCAECYGWESLSGLRATVCKTRYVLRKFGLSVWLLGPRNFILVSLWLGPYTRKVCRQDISPWTSPARPQTNRKIRANPVRNALKWGWMGGIIIIIRFHGLNKQSAFIAQLVAVHEFVQSVLEDLQWWSINDLCGNRFQQFTTRWLKKHVLHCFSDLVQFLVMPSKLYSISSAEELHLVYVFNVSQYFIRFY